MAQPLEIQLLGPISVRRNGQSLDLPQSKKTRALLAYLAVSGREHSRERLCELLWDVVDDPRGALRWCLSKLRQVVDEGEDKRLIATRQTVHLDRDALRVDVLALRSLIVRGVGSASTDDLKLLASRARAEFLEGLELPDFHEFQAWNMAQRSQAQDDVRSVLSELVSRHQDRREEGLVYVRALVQADPLSEGARAQLLEVLVALGRHEEARCQFEAALRLANELGTGPMEELEASWRRLREHRSDARLIAGQVARPTPPPAGVTASRVGAASDSANQVPAGHQQSILIGRHSEREKLLGLLAQVEERGTARAVLLSGEAGIGKTCLVDDLAMKAEKQALIPLRGRCYEIEGGRPFGPWQDALAPIVDATSSTLFHEPEPSSGQTGREQLFSRVVDLIADVIAESNACLLIFDDIQWIDRDSAELLHFVARHNLRRPLFLVLAARTGEVDDNGAATTVLRSLRRDLQLQDIGVSALSERDIGQLVGAQGPESEELYRACSGNPLFALEIARAQHAGLEDLPSSIFEIIRERLDKLPTGASDVLRWAAVLGQTFGVDQLTSLSAQSPEEVIDALESLERHGLMSLHGQNRCSVAHDVVRSAVYAELSGPRRRLMHRRIAESLAARGQLSVDIASLAHHATLAGESKIAVGACVQAARRALRMYAYADADKLVRRGLALVSSLADPERTTFAIDLYEVRLSVSKPPDSAACCSELENLADHALDLGEAEHARLGYHLLSYLRWEAGSLADARRTMLEAARVSRSAEPLERAVALGEAARCLALLERDLAQAEAFTLEAEALVRHEEKAGHHALFCATGMLNVYRGLYEKAEADFNKASELAQQGGHRIGEFQALECLCMLLIDSARFEAALDTAMRLQRIAEKLPEGSELPMSLALVELSRQALQLVEGSEALDKELETLRVVDAKFRLAFVASRAALIANAQDRSSWAQRSAQQALQAAQSLHRPTEIAVARAALMGTQMTAEGAGVDSRLLGELRASASSEISQYARRVVEEALGKYERRSDS